MTETSKVPIMPDLHRIAVFDPPISPGSLPISRYPRKPTLNSSLGTNGRGQTHSTGDEVREDLVGARGSLGRVFAEIRNLQGVLRGKRTFEGRAVSLRGDDGAGCCGQLLASASAQQRAGSGRESHGEKAIADQLQVNDRWRRGAEVDGTRGRMKN